MSKEVKPTNSKKANAIGMPILFIFASLLFILGSKPVENSQQAPDEYTKQVLAFVESCAQKEADTVDANMYKNIDVEAARNDSVFYANRIQEVMQANNNFVPQTEKPVLIGDVAPIGYKQETNVDLGRMNSNLELKQAARGYNDAVVELIMYRRQNSK